MSSDLIITILSVVVFALLTIALVLFRQVKRVDLSAFVEHVTPDGLQPIALWAVTHAYDAVEQVASAYESMSSEEKQEQAAEWATEIYQFLTTGKLTQGAATALLEAQIYASKAPAPEPAKEAIPRVEQNESMVDVGASILASMAESGD